MGYRTQKYIKTKHTVELDDNDCDIDFDSAFDWFMFIFYLALGFAAGLIMVGAAA